MKILVRTLFFIFLLIQVTSAQTEFSQNVFQQSIFSEQSISDVNVNPDSVILDSIIVAEMNRKSYPGFASIIIKDNKVIWNKNYGYRNRESQLSVEDSTIFLIASTSKTMVATAIMQLWEQGLIDLDSSINKYLPVGLTVHNPFYPSTEITVKMLMTHTASIADNWDVLNPLLICGDSPIKLDDFLSNYLTPGGSYYAQGNFYNYPPGNQWNYASGDAGLLALMVENITGNTFNDYCKDNIFSPLSMNSASWFLDRLDLNQVAVPYNPNPMCHLGFPNYPSGFLRINKIDLSHFLLAYLNDGVYDNYRILDSATVKYILSDQIGHSVFDIGFEWMQGLLWYNDITLNNLSGSTLTWGHNGSWPGCLSGMAHNPDENWGYIFFINWRPINDVTGGESDIQTNIIRYVHLYGNIYAIRPSLDKNYVKADIDSLLFQTRFSNQYNHQFSSHLIYSNSDSTEIDSLILLDDGFNGDQIANDGIYGAYIFHPKTEEDFYSIGVSTYDNETNKYFYTPNISRFTTAGPVIVDSLYSAYQPNLKRYAFRLYLKNLGNTVAINNPSVRVICNDSWVSSIMSDNLSCSTIIANQVVACNGATSIYYDSTASDPPIFNLRFEISNDGYNYWSMDTVINIVSGIDDEPQFPSVYNLEQNFPNPFNPRTTIQYSIPRLNKVKLIVFNILGEKIKELVDEEKMPGNYEIGFNADNIPSGVYFYQLKAGDFIETKKMILIK